MDRANIPLSDVLKFLVAYAEFRLSRRECVLYKRIHLAIGSRELDVFEQERYQERHAEATNTLLSKTPFQKFIEKDARYQNAFNRVLKGKVAAFLWGGEEEERLPHLYSLKDELSWRLQYIFACAIFAYEKTEFMASFMEDHFFFKKRFFSESTKLAAKKLYRSIHNDLMDTPMELDKCLTHIMNDDDFSKYDVDHYPGVRVSQPERRRYTIFQICLVASTNEFMPARSKKGRFYPEVVTYILDFLGEDELSQRTVEFIMEPFDVQSLEKMDDEKALELRKSTFTYSIWHNYMMYEEQVSSYQPNM
ncbi:MAG: hypothetical protein CMK46_00740 [Porticoccus sp.]|nr:hypothetical protein [Porticoccus sp.]|tara:strand:- start:6815 stop:7732 length:918 start_codon:yes stop_codon:yes gene_type:complete